MPVAGKVQVASLHISSNVSTGQGFAFQIGARGEAVELLGVHYFYTGGPMNVDHSLLLGISSNPGHLTNPPSTLVGFLADKAIYGENIRDYRQLITVEGGRVSQIQTVIIPLYGLVRPRRQILVSLATTPSVQEVRAEVYYRPVTLSKIELDSLDLKYGKYRRGA
ncbi:hypothetical protein LCGC14_2039890 [marine sediment metagenome]|uniref:Uncharacterized protein n=1 Tax=marine sediment metagenome TaxID=412755 RepID=A0A0F9H5M6_9ZZZZ